MTHFGFYFILFFYLAIVFQAQASGCDTRTNLMYKILFYILREAIHKLRIYYRVEPSFPPLLSSHPLPSFLFSLFSFLPLTFLHFRIFFFYPPFHAAFASADTRRFSSYAWALHPCACAHIIGSRVTSEEGVGGGERIVFLLIPLCFVYFYPAGIVIEIRFYWIGIGVRLVLRITAH